MSQKHLNVWLHCHKANGIGNVTSQKLRESFADFDDIFQLSNFELKKIGLSTRQITNWRDSCTKSHDIEFRWLEASEKHFILTPDCDLYPLFLKETHDYPVIIYGVGDPKLLQNPQIAVVGTRHPTPSGVEACKDFTDKFCQNNWTITSGLALGIDGIAHQQALESNGVTIAVAGTGMDRIYPARHKDLAYQVIESGVIISEFPLGTGVNGRNFPKRNRIISGLSQGVFVVEAALKSGSLITADYAIQQGRDVFALPSSIHNPMAKGTHWLIKQGAVLAETPYEIMEQIGWLGLPKYKSEDKAHSISEMNKLDPDLKRILECVDFAPTDIDSLVDMCKISVAELSTKLLTLELDGWISQAAGGYQRQK